MKPKQLLFTCLLAMFVSIQAHAYDYDFVRNEIYYIVTSAEKKTVEVARSDTYSGDITIPSTVTYMGLTYTVESIGDNAFDSCSGLTSVNIPGSVTRIGSYAFSGCSSLTSVNIPNSVTHIFEYTFSGCTSLTSVTIPNSVTSIGEDAFLNCSGLTKAEFASIESLCSISFYDIFSNPLCYAHHLYIDGKEVKNLVIPNSVTSIGYSAFYGCSSLTSITIPNSVTRIYSYAFSGCSGLTSITIPNSVTSIGYEAFYGCTSLTSITIPNSVTSIREGAFRDCYSLTSITIPNSVTSIGNYAFSGCSGLTSINVEAGNTTYDSRNDCNAIIETATNTLIAGCQNTTIPNSVTSIGSIAFYGCTSLTSITIPNSVTSIGIGAFYGCSSLTSITIPNNVTSIGNNAFSYCRGLTSITIPNSVTSIGRFAFYNCSKLTSINIPNSVTSIGDGAFDSCSGLTSLTIGNSVTSIGDWTFYECTGLTSITIPNSVTSIGYGAFSGCSGLTSLTIGNSVTSIGSFAFGGCSDLTDVYCFAINVPSTDSNAFYNSSYQSATLHVPAGSLDAYKTTAPWSSFVTIEPINEINDEMTSFSVAAKESGKPVIFTHNFNGDWEALYLPFAIDYDAIRDDFDLAEIDGIVQNDDDNDGIADITVLSIMGFKGQKTEPNMPYLIRAKNAGEQIIIFNDVTVYPTTEESIDCSSTSTRYEFTGTYNSLNASALANRYVVQGGELVKGASSLAPCRWYMTATARKGSLNLPSRIRIMPVEDVITGVETLSDSPLKGEDIYNLAGLRLSKPQKGINIKNGKKYLMK